MGTITLTELTDDEVRSRRRELLGQLGMSSADAVRQNEAGLLTADQYDLLVEVQGLDWLLAES